MQMIATWGALAGTIATAIATFFLWRVTKLLAVETKRMADASARPQVVATITLNPWAMNHADLTVQNTGNATAFNIVVEFEPPLPGDAETPGGSVPPFQRVSILKPGQELTSYLSESYPMIDMVFTVSISWTVVPDDVSRQELSYTLRMSDYKGMSRLGATDPAIQIAEQVKKIREDWEGVARGHKKLKADVYTDVERKAERRRYEEMRGRNGADQRTLLSRTWERILATRQRPR